MKIQNLGVGEPSISMRKHQDEHEKVLAELSQE